MTNKTLELEVRQIMQGLEEFATFMSYQSNYEGLRSLKVETQDPTAPRLPPDNGILFDRNRPDSHEFVESSRLKQYK